MHYPANQKNEACSQGAGVLHCNATGGGLEFVNDSSLPLFLAAKLARRDSNNSNKVVAAQLLETLSIHR